MKTFKKKFSYQLKMSAASSNNENEEINSEIINDEQQSQAYPESPIDSTQWESSQKRHELPLEPTTLKSTTSLENVIDVGEEMEKFIACSKIPLPHFPVPTNPNNFSIGDLPFTTHPTIDPRAAASLIGMQALSNLDVLGDIPWYTIKSMAKHTMSQSEIKSLLEDAKAVKQIKEKTLELLIEQGRKSFIFEALQNFSKSRICYGYLKDYLDGEEFSFEVGITTKNYFSDNFITAFTGVPCLASLMEKADHEHLLHLIFEMRDNSFFPAKGSNKKMKH